jgi:hypothetical protein
MTEDEESECPALIHNLQSQSTATTNQDTLHADKKKPRLLPYQRQPSSNTETMQMQVDSQPDIDWSLLQSSR